MIKILRFIKLDKPTHIGIVDIQLMKWGGFIIYGCSIFQKNGHRWISFPSKKVEVPSGEVRYLPYMRYEDRAMQDKFSAAVIAALDAWISAGNKPETIQKREAPMDPQAPQSQPAYGPGSNGAYAESNDPPF